MRRRERKRSAGYTIVEVMMGIFIVSIGFLGLTSLQTSGFMQSRSLQDTILGLNCAQHFMETVREEALTWTLNNPLNVGGSWTYLKNLPSSKSAGAQTNWLVASPSAGTDKRSSALCGDPSFNPSVSTALEGGNVKYCIHYRFTWLIPDYLMRLDVRVMWPIARSNWNKYKSCPAPPSGNTGGMADDLGMVEFVTLSSTVMQNTNIALE